jgi:hypothetical protein
MHRREELLISFGVVAAGVALAAIGKRAYSGLVAIAAIVIIFIVLFWLSNRRVDRRVVRAINDKIDEMRVDLLAKFLEFAEAAKLSTVEMRYELFEHWRGMTVNSTMNSQSKIIPEPAVLGLESTSREVWIWAYRLTWEIEDEKTLQTVSKNLHQGVSYRYLLPDSEEIHMRVRQFLDRLGTAPTALPLEFRMRENHSSLLDQCVTIYYSKGSEDSEEPVVVLFPPKVARETQTEQLFVQLSGEAARPIQNNYAYIWHTAEPVEA